MTEIAAYSSSFCRSTRNGLYYDSTLLKKEIIKYGTMTNEGGGVYTFRAAGQHLAMCGKLFKVVFGN